MQSLTRAMEILEHLRNSDKACSIAELVQASALPPSTVHRILQTFYTGKYVIRNEKTHLYHLGPALIPLGIAATNRLNLRDIAHPILVSLMQATEEDAFLIVKSNYKGLTVDKVEGPNNLKIIEKYGTEMDMHCGALRKSLLAFQTDEYIEEYMRHGLTRHTENTIINPDKLMESLKEIRANRIAVSRGEYITDALGVGAPIFDMHQKAIASIGIIAPASRATDEKVKEFLEFVRKCANELTFLMGNVNPKNQN